MIKPLGITITDAARKLGVSRKTLFEFDNKKASLRPEMDLRIAKAAKKEPGKPAEHADEIGPLS